MYNIYELFHSEEICFFTYKPIYHKNPLKHELVATIYPPPFIYPNQSISQSVSQSVNQLASAHACWGQEKAVEVWGKYTVYIYEYSLVIIYSLRYTLLLYGTR